MHPPFIFTDHRVAVPSDPPRGRIRRGRPTRLDLTPVVPHWPPVLPVRDAGAVTLTRADPALRHQLQARIGRFLIRIGHRMLQPSLRASAPRLKVLET